MCYNNAYIDFTQFNSALIVGKKENDDKVSNGVGKTTIFKAIEYVLFNHSDINLEDIIRDETDSCCVALDFIVDDQEYRVIRTRTKKTTDISLLKRTANQGSDDEVLHKDFIPLRNEKFWIDISGRRSADTEKELAKLLKINIKSFRVFVHFMQADFSGLTTATPEKRKALLRDALNLIIYPKLEKIAKDKLNTLNKECDKFKILVENLNNPDLLIQDFSNKLNINNNELTINANALSGLQNSFNDLNKLINKLSNDHSNLEGKFSSLLAKEQLLNSEKSRIEISVKEYTTKKNNVLKLATDLVQELKSLENNQKQLSELDFSQIDTLQDIIVKNKEKIAQLNLTNSNNALRVQKLKIPIPDNGECESCRQIITPEHKQSCQKLLDNELKDLTKNIQDNKNTINLLSQQNIVNQQTIVQLKNSKTYLEGLNSSILSKKKDVVDKKASYEEYSTNLKKFQTELEDKQKQLLLVFQELKESSLDQAKVLQLQINKEKLQLTNLNNQIINTNKIINNLNANSAVLEFNLNKSKLDKTKKEDYLNLIIEFDKKIVMYPSVIQAFSSTGIPNLIIQNVLEDLQLEANNLLSQLKPDIQLSFAVEKTIEKTGDQADTLDINYTVNGKKRYYEILSGAQKLAVTFALKLGLSFLLQKMAGVDIKFLLLDELDQSLDKASVDSLADIVQAFQKEFTILVITHNDQLKHRFKNIIVVEQDVNFVSNAKVC
jgi:DNA repair exonuclease SbcCD ATPase subunit